nr:IgGFc-binding protein [Methylomicrobium sp. RS1]
MENYRNDGNPSNIYLYLTTAAPQGTTVTVEAPGYGPQSFPVSPNTITSVSNLPLSLRASGSGTIENKGLLLSAPDEFVVYGLNQQKFTTDAYLGLPTDLAGTEYIVPSFPSAKKTLSSELQVVAHEDGTVVTFTPTRATVKGRDVKSVQAGKSAQFTLNRLQSIQFKAKGGYPADLTGSIITASKPISVFGGHQCGVVPSKSLACDHMVEQIPPTNTWGTSFFTTPLATRKKGDVFRILAANDGTEVQLDGDNVALLKKGKFKDVDLASGSFHQIQTSKPALVVQYSKGQSVDGVPSDPFMMIIPPAEQFGSDYVVSTPASEPVSFVNYINIVAPTSQLAGLRLDGEPISASAFLIPFTPIGATGYSGAQVSVNINAHTINHLLPNVPFGVYSYGFASSDSYGYPGGSRLAKIAEACTATGTEQGDGIDNDCDRRIDEELSNGLDDDGDGKIDEDLAQMPFEANAGGPYTVNEGGSVTLNGSADSDTNADQLTFEWDLDNNGSFEISGATPSFQGSDGPSVHSVTLKVVGLGGSSQAVATVTVNNVAPTVNAGADATLNRGSAFNQSGSFSDPGTDTWSATVDYGDGSGVQPLPLNGKNFGLNHLYAGNGTYTVTVTVTDDDGGTGSDTVQVNVQNQPPTVNAGADATLNGGSAFNQSGSFSDPDSASWSATVDYGDGSGVQPLPLNGKNFGLNHLYAGNGTYTVTVTVTDDDGGTGSDTVQVNVQNQPPTVNAGADATLNGGSAFNQSGSFSDPDSASWSATVDYGDGSGVQPLPLNGKNFGLNHLYAGNGTYTVTVTVTDDDGGTGSDTVQVNVQNQPPTVNAGADATLNGGSAFNQSGSFSDPDSASWSATVDYGDGSGVQPLPLNGKNFGLNHLYAGNGTYTVTVTVTDDDGGTGSDTVQVTVNNVAPSITEASWNNGCDAEVTVAYSDPANNFDNPYSLTINWRISFESCSSEFCSPIDYQQTVSNYSSGTAVSLDYNPEAGSFIGSYTPTSVVVSDKDGGSDIITSIPNSCG